MSYTRRAHNSSVVALLKKAPYVLICTPPHFFINTPSYNRDHLEYIHKSSTYERSKYISSAGAEIIAVDQAYRRF
jgi:hypothetical protein